MKNQGKSEKQNTPPNIVTIQEALNNVETIEECVNHSEYFIKVAFSFMKKAEKIQMEQNDPMQPEKTE